MASMKTAVIGAAGYAGIEVVRHLLGHPNFELVAATSDGDAGKLISDLYPALQGRTDLAFQSHAAIDAIEGLGAVFLAVPHTAAIAMAPGLLARGISVFDLSADFRIKDPAVYQQWYGAEQTEVELLDRAIYGLPEVNRQKLRSIKHPALVACPGCYPTASALAAAPAFAAGIAAVGKGAAPVIINALSGVSGAGRSASQTTHFCSANENVNAYGVTTHRHTPEIAQTLSQVAGTSVAVVFTPHLAPLTRGLLSTVAVQLKAGVTVAQVEELYAAAYADEPFVEFLPLGTMPRTASVVGSNNAHVGIALDETTGTLIASCAIDNLGKGAAAQAVQCANIVFGYPETEGLTAIGRIL